MEIKLLEVKITGTEGGEVSATVAGRASISIDGVEICDIKIIERDPDRPFLGWPSWRFTEKNGRYSYRDYVKLPRPLKRQVEDLILKRYQFEKVRREKGD